VIDEVYFLTVEEVVAVHEDQIDRYGGDPDERLYDVMISVATKAIGKPEIATTLRSLVAPVSG